MGSLFSAISGQFTRVFVFAFLVPAAAFVVLSILVFAPLVPTGFSVFEPLSALDSEWQVAAVALLTVVLAGLLQNLNLTIIRWYEGYPWAKSWWGHWRTGRYQREFDRLRLRMAALDTILLSEPPGSEELHDEVSRVNRELLARFPDDRALILPTRLGNTIRSFERYPSIQYEMDAIVLWPRLVAVIPADYLGGIDQSQATFAFHLNCSILSAVLCAMMLSVGVMHASPHAWLGVSLPTIAFAVLSYCFYGFSVTHAESWGAVVKSAFDLYRWPLLRQMGYPQEPKDREAERLLWQRISAQVIFGDQCIAPGRRAPYRVAYSASSTWAFALPSHLDLRISRGVSSRDSGFEVTVEVFNADENLTATNLLVSDTVPAGFQYEWNSAAAPGRKIHVEGFNPYKFVLDGDLPPRQSACMTYRMLRLGRDA